MTHQNGKHRLSMVNIWYFAFAKEELKDRAKGQISWANWERLSKEYDEIEQLEA